VIQGNQIWEKRDKGNFVLCHTTETIFTKKNMSEVANNKEATTNSNNTNSNQSNSTTSPNELKKAVKIQELPSMMNNNINNHMTMAGITRERSFVRTTNPQNHQVCFGDRRNDS